MIDPQQLAEGLEQIPFNAFLGVKTVVAEPGHFEVALPARPELLNHVDSVHAVPITAPAEAASGCAVASLLGDLFAEGYFSIARSLRVRYRRLAKGDLLAVPRLDRDVLDAAVQRVRAEGRADFEVPVDVKDASGEVVAEVVVEWALRKGA
jgi:acyl-coenzyme A thioesterase PaaI-like protein